MGDLSSLLNSKAEDVKRIFSCVQLAQPVKAVDDDCLKVAEMATLMPMEAPPAGFNFENCKRNAMLAQQGFKPPKVKHKFRKNEREDHTSTISILDNLTR